MVKLKVLALVMGGALFVAACGAPEATPTPTPSTVNAAGGYSTNCGPCHGADRKGVEGLGKPLTQESLAPLSDSAVKDVIENGREGTVMVAWKDLISDEEIDALAQFLKNN